LRTKAGETWIPGIVRLGRSDAINAEAKDVALEEKVEARMAPVTDASKSVTPGDILNSVINILYNYLAIG
jgi:hypothetical protein